MVSDGPLARHLVVLGEALRPLLRRVEAELAKPMRPTGTGETFPIAFENTTGHMSDALQRLDDERIRMFELFRVTTDVPEAQVHDLVVRFEAVVDDLLGRYAELRQARPRSAHVRGHELLTAAFRHPLTHIRVWLRDVVEVVADPTEFLRSKGLPASGKVEVCFDFTYPKEIDEFRDWVAERKRASRMRGFWYFAAIVAAGFLVCSRGGD